MGTYINNTLMLGLSEVEGRDGLAGSVGECSLSSTRDYALIIMSAFVSYAV